LLLLWEYPGLGQDRTGQGPKSCIGPPLPLDLQTGAAANHSDSAAAPVLYQGTESLLATFAAPKGKLGGGAGWDLPDDFSVQGFALSQDGQRAWLLLFNGDPKLSRDGSVLAALAPFSYFSSSRGFYVYREGPASPAHPKIKSVRQRYEGSKLFITVEADHKYGLGHVSLLALKHGYLQAAHCFKKAEDNPLQAFGVNLCNLTPDAKRPGAYQLVVDLGSRKAQLDQSYSLRIVAVNEPGNRTTFVDVPVLRGSP
jgi:hypothetical protein